MTNRLPTALVLASASSASAGIVVFDINPDFQAPHNSSSLLEVGSLNFSNGTFSSNAISGRWGLFSIDNFSIARTVYFGTLDSESYVDVNNTAIGNSLISSGVSIDASSNFTNSKRIFHYIGDTPVGTHYIALSTNFGGGNQYGWIEFTAAYGNGEYNDFTFTRFAFNDIAGQSILAGQTTAIPEASTLGLVGGLFGLVAAAHVRRRRQQKAAASDKFLALAAGEKLN